MSNSTLTAIRATDTEWFADLTSRMAHKFGVSKTDIHSRQRTATVALARQAVMFIARKSGRFTLMQIGGYFQRDHGAVINACEVITRLQASGADRDLMAAQSIREVADAMNVNIA